MRALKSCVLQLRPTVSSLTRLIEVLGLLSVFINQWPSPLKYWSVTKQVYLVLAYPASNEADSASAGGSPSSPLLCQCNAIGHVPG